MKVKTSKQVPVTVTCSQQTDHAVILKSKTKVGKIKLYKTQPAPVDKK